MSELSANLAVGAGILLAGVAVILMLLGLISYSRLRHARLLWVAVAFLGFALEGAYLAWMAYDRRLDVAAGTAGEFPILAFGNLAIVIALYLAVLKR